MPERQVGQGAEVDGGVRGDDLPIEPGRVAADSSPLKRFQVRCRLIHTIPVSQLY